MQVSVNILIISPLQLLLLIAAVNMTVFMHSRYKTRFSATDMLLLIIQAANLVFLLQDLKGRGMFNTLAAGNDSLILITQVLLIVLILGRFIWVLRRAPSRRRDLLTPQSIRETIDYLPGGISISSPKGKPVLTNYRMNQLIFQLTGHTIVNACAVWEDLSQAESKNGCLRLNEFRLFEIREQLPPAQNHSSNAHSDENCINVEQAGEYVDDSVYFLLPDDRIWRFRKDELTDRTPHYIQLEATDITDLYNYSKELYENNERLKEQYIRQQSLLTNIVQINHEKEILSTKMRIHDDLGRSILITKQHLSNKTLSDNIPHLAEIWNNTIRNLIDFTHVSAEEDNSPEIELRKAADMVGCHIEFHGDRLSNRKTMLLFYAAVREALSNAVMHAGADRLIVSAVSTDRGYHVEISDNGTKPVYSVAEGNGLSNLRKKLEREGGALKVSCTDGVVLIIDLPEER